MSRLLGCCWVKVWYYWEFVRLARFEELKLLSSLNAPGFHSLPSLSLTLKNISTYLTKTAMVTKGIELAWLDIMTFLQA